MVMYQLIFTLLKERLNSASGTAAEAEVADVSATESNSGKSSSVTGKFSEIIRAASEKYDVDADLIQAVIKAESNFNASAVSSCGALGLMQLMPATAKSLGVDDPLDPKQNIFGGTKFLHRLLDKYNNNVSLALAAYNAGPGAVDKYGGIPPYSETQTYVKRVLNYLA
ncbi:MAG: lytic transglycosylase domain-containing protein [Anaerolineales bacterium]|nr:lytic transglycosylase domain-containing protein [Anaerolineales bacterium]